MALKILMVSRFNSDFERWVSLADYLHDKFDVHMLHAWDLERLKNPAMFALLKSLDIKLMQYSDLSFAHRIFLIMNGLARRFSSKLLWKMGQFFRRISHVTMKQNIDNYLRDLDPDILFITEFGEQPDTIYESLKYAYEWFHSNNRWIIGCAHASKIYFSPNDRYRVNKHINIYFSTSDEQSSRIGGESLAHPVTNVGDVRNSVNFLNKLKPFLKKACDGRTVALFVGEKTSTDYEYCDFIIQLIQMLSNDKDLDNLIVKLHPNSDWYQFSLKLVEHPKVTVISTQFNSIEVCAAAEVVISHQSSIIFDALAYKKKLFLIDYLDGPGKHLYRDLELPSFNFKQWLELENIMSLPFSYNTDAYKKLAFNNADDGENRELVYQFLLNHCQHPPM